MELWKKWLRSPAVSVLLLGLVLTLGILQYRWAGQIADAERERMQEGVEASLRRFAENFDDELRDVVRAFRVRQADIGRLEAIAEAWADEAHHPAMFRDFYWVTWRDGENDSWRRLGSGSQDGAPELSALKEVFQRIGYSGARPPRPFLFNDPPSIAFPLFEGGMRRGELSKAGYLVAVLDSEALASGYFVEAVAHHFGTSSGLLYDVVVVDRNGDAVFATGGADVDAIVSSADASAPLFTPRGVFVGPSRLRTGSPRSPNGARRWPRWDARRRPRGNGGGPSEARAVARDDSLHPMRSPWRVHVRHREGSLDRAVSRARFRNLALSFTVLGLLGLSVVLVSLSARRASELSAHKMEFVAGVSHELRTPLAVIRSAAQNLSDGSTQEPAQVRRYGELIESNGRRLTDLVDQVLALAGVSSASATTDGSARFSRLCVSDLVEGALADVAAVIADNNATVSSRVSDTVSVHGDAAALQRAIANLVANAAKHGGPSANIAVVAAKREPNLVVVSVSDHGKGISSEDRDHLFDAFYRGRVARERQTPGSGLGLHLVEEIARAHRGSVEVESNGGEGATFRLVLPEASRNT